MFDVVFWSTFLEGILMTSTKYSTLLLVFITGIYAFFTYRTLGFMTKEKKEKERPRIKFVIDRRSKGYTYLLIQNIGLNPAENVKITILDKDIKGKIDGCVKTLSEKPIFKNVILSFLSNHKAYVPLTDNLVIKDEKGDYVPKLFIGDKDGERDYVSSFKITCSYNWGEKSYNEKTIIDINACLEVPPQENKIVSSIKIEK